ncbi:hypothetical protein [Clostridium sp. UBA7791]|uniref:hypothetical protein n=1 Tax=Clostridium TaxID=1485 RepID=UPI000E9545E1|nr:hypothetical protein [Clostridium sp.]
MSYNLNPEELVVAAAVLSLYIAKNRTSDEINLLGNLFQAIGTNLSTIATVTPQNESTINNKNNTNE